MLYEIEKNLISVSETLTNNSEVEKNLVASIDSVTKTINDLSSFVAEIDSIGTEIELIALNASIKAAHTGENGAPMGIIAESIQKLSKEAKEQTTIIVDALSKVTVVANQLHSELVTNSGKNSEEELNLMTGNISSLLKLIGNHDNENKTSLSKIKSKVKQLFKDIEYTANEVAIHIKFKEFVLDLSNELGKIMQETMFYSKNIKKSDKLDNMQNKYTMESERDIYKKVLSFTDSKSATKNNKNTTSSSEDEKLGDNVELF